jgi:hypothetical protein
MAEAFNQYVGDGTTVLYPFTFEYLETDDIFVKVNQQLNTDWVLSSATEITFNTAPATLADIFIFRKTDIESMDAVFAAASAIRARDLNTDFEQLRLAVQEAREIPGNVLLAEIDKTYWNRNTNTIDSTEPWTADDEHVATTQAVQNYVQASEQVGVPEAPNDGQQYGRQSDTWTVIEDAGIGEAPIDGFTYGRNNASWELIVGGSGGIVYKGTIDLTLAPPMNPTNGDLYVNVAAGTVNAGWIGIAGDTVIGSERVVFQGLQWELLPVADGGTVDEIIAGTAISVNNANESKPIVSVNVSALNTTFMPYNIGSLPSLP